MKTKITILLLISLNVVISQNIRVDYERIKIALYDGGVDLISPTTLFLSQKESIFLEDFLIDGKNSQVTLEEYRKGNKTGKYIYGDSLGQIIIKNRERTKYEQRRKFAEYDKDQNVYRIVIDSIIPYFNWEITQQTKQILGQSVQKANVDFKGRKIEAWFATEIALNDGPWKFSGLPGLILEVKIDMYDEEYWTYKAVSISKIDKLPNVDFNKQIPKVTLKELEESFIKKYKNQYKYYQSKSNGEIKVRYNDLDFAPIIFPEEK